MSRTSTGTSTPSQRWVTGGVLVAGAVVANVAFFGLGSTFEYPDILDEPTRTILELFDANRAATMTWFAVLALGAAMLVPGAILLARHGRHPAARWSALVGAAAGLVQVIGLSRWFLLVPGYADRALDPAATAASRLGAEDAFETAHRILGTVVGESLGYLLTAGWTVLVLLAFPVAARWWRAWGGASAALILLGLLVPFDVPGTDVANFVGYVIWSVWLIALAWLLVRGRLAPAADPSSKPRAALPV